MHARFIGAAALVLVLLAGSTGWAGHNPSILGVVDGITSTNFELAARDGYISSPEGNSIYTWSYADLTDASLPFQYPGPTFIVHQGQTITVELTNELTENTSIVFPGMSGMSAAPDPADATSSEAGLLTLEAKPGGKVIYTFTADRPGTYMYHSGTRTDLQIEMGLVGAIIVRPAGFDLATQRWAYDHASTAYEYEYLFLQTEMDLAIHTQVEQGDYALVDTRTRKPTMWFLNGRPGPDTLFPAFAPWLPTQPYNCTPTTEPNERVLMRVIGGGSDLHPFHFHGNHANTIALDGGLLSSQPLAGPAGPGIDLSFEQFTHKTVPGSTADLIWDWTGNGLGWDVYGHGPDDPLMPGEDPADHGKPFPTLLPEQHELTFGGWWSGSPFLGAAGNLPPGEGGLNPFGGYTFMWHSHTEKELTNNDVFPGGMMTLMTVVPQGSAVGLVAP